MQPRPDAFEMRQQFGEYFAPNSVLTSFGMNFALRLGEEQKNKKMSSSQNLRLQYLIRFTRSVMMFYRKAFVVTCFWAKVLWSPCATTAVYSRLGGTNSDLGGARPTMPPLPCIGVARIFDWGSPNQKSHVMTSSEIFEEGTFSGTKTS